MKNDLISREELFRKLCEDTKEGTFEFTESQAEAADKIVRYVVKIIQDIPSVNVVLLDNLCELLSKNADCPHEHSTIQDNCYIKTCTECWKSVLKEWMEDDYNS